MIRTVRDFPDALVLIRGHSDDVKYQGVFRLSAHDTVQGRQLADAVGCRQHCRAANTSVTVRCIGRIQFVGTADPLHLWAAFDRVTYWKK